MAEKTVVARHTGGMRFVATTGSGHDVVVDNAEGDTGPRPTELVVVALATCTGMDIASILAKKRQRVHAYRVEVRAVQREERPDVFTRIEVVHVVEGEAISETAVRRAIELSATKYCPVSAMLCAGTAEIHHRYRIEDRGSGPEPTVASGTVLVTGPYQRPETLAPAEPAGDAAAGAGAGRARE
ncbi:MAG TPA: OsmC family protein [Candidatus Limnocylindrales bacterium]|nr:OsmC family protein [Candidatus Limnocylindrales bacterium]